MAEKYDFTNMFENAEITPIPNLQIELLPCPFCGGEAKLRKTIELAGHGMITTSYFVECVDCKVRGNHFDSWLDEQKNAEDKAVEFWNTRKERGGEK